MTFNKSTGLSVWPVANRYQSTACYVLKSNTVHVYHKSEKH